MSSLTYSALPARQCSSHETPASHKHVRARTCELCACAWGCAGAQQWLHQAIPFMLQGCQSPDANLRQCAVYGLGMIAQHRPEAFRPIATQAVSAIMTMLTSPQAKCVRLGTQGFEFKASGVVVRTICKPKAFQLCLLP